MNHIEYEYYRTLRIIANFLRYDNDIVVTEENIIILRGWILTYVDAKYFNY